jgi:coatomer subunit gamma
MVTYEAAKSLCELSENVKLDLESPYASLLLFISNGNSVLKYSALKVLNRLASHNPTLVSQSTSELEPLINDSNSSVASVAISTLLKTCTQAYV